MQSLKTKSLELNVTFSGGITDLNSGEIDSPDTMISLADKALYAAKERGRNCTVLAHDLTGVNFVGDEQKTERVNQLRRKLAGLDGQFQDLILQTIEEIMHLLEQRDVSMADHARKVQRYAVLIAQEMGLPQRTIKKLEIAAMLHDIGMLAMPDSVLLGAGKLNDQQMEMMRKHPLLSVRIMESMDFLEQEIPAVRYHHEWFDGHGYPEGIAGPAIPLTARVLAVADSFDAMTSPARYRQGKSKDEALRELRRVAGSQFDPAVIDAFVAVANRLGDELMGQPGPDSLVADQPAAATCHSSD